jgi:hypothetical protein
MSNGIPTTSDMNAQWSMFSKVLHMSFSKGGIE